MRWKKIMMVKWTPIFYCEKQQQEALNPGMEKQQQEWWFN